MISYVEINKQYTSNSGLKVKTIYACPTTKQAKAIITHLLKQNSDAVYSITQNYVNLFYDYNSFLIHQPMNFDVILVDKLQFFAIFKHIKEGGHFEQFNSHIAAITKDTTDEIVNFLNLNSPQGVFYSAKQVDLNMVKSVSKYHNNFSEENTL